jgi:hypothetical protein
MVRNGINVAQTKRVSLDELDLKTDRWEFVTYFGMQASELDTTIDFISLSCIVSYGEDGGTLHGVNVRSRLKLYDRHSRYRESFQGRSASEGANDQ